MPLTRITTDEGLQIFRYTQNDAFIYGGEVMVELLPITLISISSTYSNLIGKKENGEDLPFIPQNKLKAEIKWEKPADKEYGGYYIKLGVSHAFEQNYPSYLETPSPDYTLVNAGLGIRFNFGPQTMKFSLTVNNLLNQEYIDHLSVLKELGFYNRGRNFVFGLKIPFGIE